MTERAEGKDGEWVKVVARGSEEEVSGRQKKVESEERVDTLE